LITDFLLRCSIKGLASGFSVNDLGVGAS
jgi:hypothetical protein